MKEILLRNRAVRTTLAGIAAIAGLSAVAHSAIDSSVINSPANIQKRVEQLVPGYNPQEVKANQQIIFAFTTRETNKLITEGAKTIEIPENVPKQQLL